MLKVWFSPFIDFVAPVLIVLKEEEVFGLYTLIIFLTGFLEFNPWDLRLIVS